MSIIDQIIPPLKTPTMSDTDEDDDGEVGQAVSRNNWESKGVTELYYFVLALSLNELTAKNESMSSEQQFEMMALYCDRWIGLFKSEFGQIHRRFMSKGLVTEEQVRAQARSDKLKNMHRKAKEVAHYVNNFIQRNPRTARREKDEKVRRSRILHPF
jgi:hypothetical protein